MDGKAVRMQPEERRSRGKGRAGAGRARPRARARLASLLVTASLAACALALWASSASAVIVALPDGRTVSYQPVRNPLGGASLTGRIPASKLENLTYHGGPVMPSNHDYAFYWAPSGSPAYAAGYQEGIDRYFESLAHDSGTFGNVDSIAEQYGDAAGEFAAYDSHFAGAIIDTDPYPKNGCKAAKICLTDAQLRAELKKYVAAHSLPTDLTHEYFLLTPPGVEDCFEANGLECSAGTSSPVYCAYHYFIPVTGGVIIYANDPYTTGIFGCDTFEHPSESAAEGTIQGGLSHEHNESITDPEVDAWYGPEGYENGDKCRTFVESSEFGKPLGTAPDGAPYNQVIDGVLYWYQQEWSNKSGSCKQRLTIKPTVTGVSPSTGPKAGGTTVTVTGTNFAPGTGGTTIRFGTHPATGVNCATGSSCTALSPASTATGPVNVTATVDGKKSPLGEADKFTYS
jgi:IPT/TIG domain-containing protein